jgi:hypothetical protein
MAAFPGDEPVARPLDEWPVVHAANLWSHDDPAG